MYGGPGMGMGMPMAGYGAMPMYGGMGAQYAPMSQYGMDYNYQPYEVKSSTPTTNFSPAMNYADPEEAPTGNPEADTFLREKGLPIEYDPRFQKRSIIAVGSTNAIKKKKKKKGFCDCC